MLQRKLVKGNLEVLELQMSNLTPPPSPNTHTHTDTHTDTHTHTHTHTRTHTHTHTHTHRSKLFGLQNDVSNNANMQVKFLMGFLRVPAFMF